MEQKLYYNTNTILTPTPSLLQTRHTQTIILFLLMSLFCTHNQLPYSLLLQHTICLSLSIYLSINYLSICLAISLSLSTYVYICICLSIFLIIYISLSVRLLIYLYYKQSIFRRPPQLRDFVCAYHPVAPGWNQKYAIYVFFNVY